MNRSLKRLLTTVIIIAGMLGITTLAYALWSDEGGVEVPSVAVGVVSFDGYGQPLETATENPATPTPVYSVNGDPVPLTLPASKILEVLGQTGPDPDPVFWRFTTQGYAQGIAGMNVTISMGDQIGPDDTVTSLTSGTARQGTILAHSTLKIYPESVNGDCSQVPATPEGPEQNIFVFVRDEAGDVVWVPGTSIDHELQKPGTYDDKYSPSTQTWCIAIDYNQQPDAVYANEVQAIGTGMDNQPHAALDRWNAIVAFPPSLDPLGAYRNRVDVIATAQDGTQSRAHATWDAMIYPDTSKEPDVTIILDPYVTNLNSGYQPT